MKKTTLVMAICLLVGMLLMQGCGTIMGGTTKAIHINSTPGGIPFQVHTISGNDEKGILFSSGVTPQMIILKRRAGWGKHYVVRFKNDEGQTKIVNVRTGLNWWYYGNIVTFSIPGLVVDLLTGACEDPKGVHVNYSKK